MSCISQSAVRKTLSKRERRKFHFYELYMLIVNLGDSTGLSSVVHVSVHFHNSHVLHTPYIPDHQVHVVMLVCACASRNTNVTSIVPTNE